MNSNAVRQFFYIVGVVATVYIAIRFVFPLVLKLTGWIIGIVITAVIFAALVAAILYSISRIADLIRK